MKKKKKEDRERREERRGGRERKNKERNINRFASDYYHQLPRVFYYLSCIYSAYKITLTLYFFSLSSINLTKSPFIL